MSHGSPPAPRGRTPLGVDDVRGRIHVVVITVRLDEYDAVESRLGASTAIVGGNNGYELFFVQPAAGAPIATALTRCVSQGNLTAQAVTNNVIHDLDPGWIFLVGIAGGVPDHEFSLGDVIIASALHDFSFGASASGEHTYHAGGGPMHPDVLRFLQTKIGGANQRLLLELAGFTGGGTFRDHPVVFTSKRDLTRRLYGRPEFRTRVGVTVMRRFPNGARPGGPRLWAGPCANGNVLVKDPELLATWQQSARQIVDVETELAGVVEAARSAGRQDYRVLAVRGLSDIVGLKRVPEWTAYACETAAAMTAAILRSGFIDFAAALPPPRGGADRRLVVGGDITGSIVNLGDITRSTS